MNLARYLRYAYGGLKIKHISLKNVFQVIKGVVFYALLITFDLNVLVNGSQPPEKEAINAFKYISFTKAGAI